VAWSLGQPHAQPGVVGVGEQFGLALFDRVAHVFLVRDALLPRRPAHAVFAHRGDAARDHQAGEGAVGVEAREGGGIADVPDAAHAVHQVDDRGGGGGLFVLGEGELRRAGALEHGAIAGHELAQFLELGGAAGGLLDEAVDVEGEARGPLVGIEQLRRRRPLGELELGVLEGEEVVDLLFDLRLHGFVDLVFGDQPPVAEDLADHLAGLLLPAQDGLQLVAGDAALRHEDVAQPQPALARGEQPHAGAREVDVLLVGAIGDGQRPDGLVLRQLLEDLAKPVARQCAAQVHQLSRRSGAVRSGAKGPSRRRARPGESSPRRRTRRRSIPGARSRPAA
jgi:hypothetical protein